MKQITISSNYTVFSSLDELSSIDKELMSIAIQTRKQAYAPYSNFQVGVILQLDNGEIIKGTNQENAAYPSGLCAERVAIFYAGANFPEATITKIFISASPIDRELDKPIPPCGACRQSIAEYEIKQNSNIEIYFMGAKGEIIKSESLSQLLPLLFDKKYL